MLVRDVMSRPVVTVGPDTPVRAAAALMTDVDAGRVTIADAYCDPVEQHAASVIAASVRGVLEVRAAMRSVSDHD